MPNLENFNLMGTYEELHNVRGIFYDNRDEKVHREMCIDAQKNVQNEFEEVLIANNSNLCLFMSPFLTGAG